MPQCLARLRVEVGQQSGVGGGEAVDLLAAVAAEQSDRHRITVPADHLPVRPGIGPAPQRLDGIVAHSYMHTCGGMIES